MATLPDQFLGQQEKVALVVHRRPEDLLVLRQEFYMCIEPLWRPWVARERYPVGHTEQHEDWRVDDTHLRQRFHLAGEANIPRDAIVLQAVMADALREIHQRFG